MTFLFSIFDFSIFIYPGSPNSYSPITTSYDYDSPISEAGDITEKYLDIRRLISQVRGGYSVVPLVRVLIKRNLASLTTQYNKLLERRCYFKFL